MEWRYLRDRYYTTQAAVDAAAHLEGLGLKFQTHPTVRAALAQIDMAERAVNSVAAQLEAGYANEPEEV
jgi:hypothetical protein